MSCSAGPKPPSQIIRAMLGEKEHTPTVEGLINAFGSQSFGLMFIVMALPLTVPLPPGLGFIPAALLCTWAFQRLLGQNSLWIPKIIGKREISRSVIDKIEVKAIPLCERLEKRFFSHSQQDSLKETEIRLASLAVVFMSLLIMLPTPFLNFIPAVITILIGPIIISNNRRLLWVNISFSLLALGYIGSTLYVESELLQNRIDGFLQSNPKFLD